MKTSYALMHGGDIVGQATIFKDVDVEELEFVELGTSVGPAAKTNKRAFNIKDVSRNPTVIEVKKEGGNVTKEENLKDKQNILDCNPVRDLTKEGKTFRDTTSLHSLTSDLALSEDESDRNDNVSTKDKYILSTSEDSPPPASRALPKLRIKKVAANEEGSKLKIVDVQGAVEESASTQLEKGSVRCYICQRVLKKKSLQNHMTKMHSNQKKLKIQSEDLVCKICQWKSQTTKEAQDHAEGHYSTCIPCNKKVRITHLKKHQREVHSETPIVCDGCDKKFSCKRYLNVHKKKYHSNAV